MQDSTFFDPDLVWFENLFPVHTEKVYHKWLKGRYVKNARFYNEMTHKRDTCDILVIIPFVNIDYMESVKGNDKFTCGLDLRNTIDGRPDTEYSSSDYDTDMECYIKFILKEDKNLYAVNDFGEVETDCTKYYNFNVTNLIGMLLLTPILGGCSKDSFDPDTGFLQKYGEKTTSDNGQECLRVKFYMNGKTVGDGGYGVSDPSYVDYFPDGSVEWMWGRNTVAKGTKIDDAGSFKVEAGNQISEDSYSGSNAHLNAKICIYPMMQYNGEDILLTGIEEMVFRVSEDDVIRFECDSKNLPSDAKIGFGSI